MITFDDLIGILGGTVIMRKEDRNIRSIILDTRVGNNQSVSDEDLFFAISGENHDGHAFIEEAYTIGIRQFVIESPAEIPVLKACNVIQVNDTIGALQNLVANFRRRFSIPVIGITGSNGKTVVKEWLYTLLSGKFHVAKNPGSYNSQVGVPLSLWRINESHEIGIFEAGISQPGEMTRLEKIMQPTIGICTNIGSAHDAGFVDREEKIAEKIKLFKNCETIIYRSDYEDLDLLMQSVYNDRKLLRWSDSGKGDILTQLTKEQLVLTYNQKSYTFQTNLQGAASFENLVHCIVLMLQLGYNTSEIQEGILLLAGVEMRMELKKGINDCSLIDDTYNNDLDGLEIALDFLNKQRHKPEALLILSDILQSSYSNDMLYAKVAELVNKYRVSRVIGIGPEISRNREFFPAGSTFFADTSSLMQELPHFDFHDLMILVKGARTYHMEKVVKFLTEKIHDTTLEINLGALVHNLNAYRRKLKPETKTMVMVKAFGYGSGDFEIAHLLQYHKVDYLGVAYVEEGVALRENGIHIPIMVMNPSPESFAKIVKYDLHAEVFSFQLLSKIISFCEQHNCEMNIHLKIDTGMHRLGFEEVDLDKLIETISQTRRIYVKGVFTHLASAEDENEREFSLKQIRLFQKIYQQLNASLHIQPLRHVLNSSGIINYPEFEFDMVRLGIGLYGYDPTGKIQDELMPVGYLKTIISQIKHIPKGESIGYNRRGKAKKSTKIATLAIGYADGFSRELGNGIGRVWVNGKSAPTMGNVCMDMTMVDITGINAEEGDEVEIFGVNQSVESLAKDRNTIPYEILTSVAGRVKRVYKHST